MCVLVPARPDDGQDEAGERREISRNRLAARGKKIDETSLLRVFETGEENDGGERSERERERICVCV